MIVRVRFVVFALFLITSLITNAERRNSVSNDTIYSVIDKDSVKTSYAGLKSDYSDAYEAALKRKEELTRRKNVLGDSVKNWTKELKKLEALHASIVKSNEKLEDKIAQAKVKVQKNGVHELIKTKNQLSQTIIANKKEKASQESQLKDIVSKLGAKNHQRENLCKIKENVSNQIIAENNDYLERPFAEMTLPELSAIKSNCKQFTSDAKVNAFVGKIDKVIKNKELYDNMVSVVSSAYNKNNVEKALASVSQIDGTNMLQQKEIAKLKAQMTSFAEGLAAFKEFIKRLNDMRNGVNYSMEFFQTDSKQIMSKNDLGKRINDKLIRVPYLKKKFEEFMTEFKKNPNKHYEVEKEILGL